MRKSILSTIVVVFFCLLAGSALGATIHVPADYSTIQGAIDAASHGDVVMVDDGTYTGPDNKNIDFGGKAIRVRSENGPENCMIDCEYIAGCDQYCYGKRR